MLIDTHCHLYLDEFKFDLNDTINRAIENGIKKIILPNIDSRSVSEMNLLKKKYDDILFTTLGLHPTSVKKDFKQELDLIFSNDLKNIVAIGEIGIDLYWDTTFFKEQQEVFDYQLNLSFENNLPVIIHSRNSMDEVFEIINLYKNKNISGVFHCYSGNYGQAKRAIDLGFYIGIGGVLTYKKSELSEIVSKIPIDYIVLETDAPYLSPVPFRGSRNEPANVKLVAEKLAGLKNIKLNEVSDTTTINAMKLFNRMSKL